MSLKVTASAADNRFVARASKDFYKAATAVDAFQNAALRTLREVIGEFEPKLAKVECPFTKLLERKGLGNSPWIRLKIARPQLEAGMCLQWYDPEDSEIEQPMCVYWWVRHNHRGKRKAVRAHFVANTKTPFVGEPGEDGTSYVSRYLSYAQSVRLKFHARECTAEFVRVLSGTARLSNDGQED